MDIIFDEQLAESDHLQTMWREVYNRMPSDIKERFGERPIHRNDKTTLPLQAADMVAWALRRLSESTNYNIGTGELFKGMFEGCQLYQDIWTRDKMLSMLEFNRRQNARNGIINEHKAKHIIKNVDFYIGRYNQDQIIKAKIGETIYAAPISASGLKRFRLVHKCPNCNSPHLHRRDGNECLASGAS